MPKRKRNNVKTGETKQVGGGGTNVFRVNLIPEKEKKKKVKTPGGGGRPRTRSVLHHTQETIGPRWMDQKTQCAVGGCSATHRKGGGKKNHSKAEEENI